MTRVSRLCFAASIALVACGRTAPLSGRRPLPADAGGSASDDGPTVDVAPAAPIPAAAVLDAAVADVAAADTALDARDVLAPADAARVPYRALGVATGEVHTCALLDDHNVKCWGDNSFGQLGYGDLRRRGNAPSEMGDALPVIDLGTGRTATAIAASRYASCAILDDGSVRCWGWGGLLGQGQVNADNLGDQPGELGDHLPALDFGGRRAVHLAMGEVAACASMDDDTLWCWDSMKPWPQFWLPVKRVTAVAPGGGGIVALYDDGSVSPMLPNGRVPALTSEHKVLALAGGVNTGTCALLDDRTITCGSDGAYRVEGPSNAIAIGVERFAGLCSAFSDGSVLCREVDCSYYPCASDGSFSLGAPAVTVTSNGTEFACALLVNGEIKCWGVYPVAPWLGAGVAFTAQSDGGVTYGAWHSVDLGTHP